MSIKWRRELVGIASAGGNDVATIARLVRPSGSLRALAKKALRGGSDSVLTSQPLRGKLPKNGGNWSGPAVNVKEPDLSHSAFRIHQLGLPVELVPSAVPADPAHRQAVIA
jgi:hypothetical protein